jgi:Cu/Ag efflux protein CusF
MIMTDRTIELDQHRGMLAQKATELRRLVAEVDADAKALRLRQEELEAQLIAMPAMTWHDAAEKARYLLGLFASTQAAQDPRRQKLIDNVLDDFQRLSLVGESDATR